MVNKLRRATAAQSIGRMIAQCAAQLSKARQRLPIVIKTWANCYKSRIAAF
jgi:hypothetical protein